MRSNAIEQDERENDRLTSGVNSLLSNGFYI